MDIHFLEYVVEIAKEKNISKAASVLYISQPTLSIYLNKLEDELGTKLFVRKSKTMEMTEAGKLYVETAEKIIEMKSELYSQIAALSAPKSKILSIGIFQNIGSQMIKEVYAKFREIFPDVRIDIVDASLPVIKQNLLDRNASIAFVAVSSKDDERFEYIQIKKEEYLLAVSKKHVNYKHFYSGMKFSELKNAKFILGSQNSEKRKIEDRLFSKNNMIAKVHSVVRNLDTLKSIVKEGEAISLIPKGFAFENEGIDYFSIYEEPFWDLVALYDKDVSLGNRENALVELVKEYYTSHENY